MQTSEFLFFKPNTDFQLFGSQHLMMMALILLLAIGLSIFAKRKLTEAQQVRLGRAMTLVMAVAVVGWIFLRMAEGLFDPKTETIDDLIRLTAVPAGAEVTGLIQTPDGKSLLINSQHPSTSNPFPYNHSLTFAIHGLDQVSYANLSNRGSNGNAAVDNDDTSAFSVYPNPTTRTVYMNKTTDVAIYDAAGKRVLVKRDTNQVDVSALPTGIYYIKNAEGETLKLSVQ